MLQQQNLEDYVIATGHKFSLQEFAATAFELLHLDWREHVIQDTKHFRPVDILNNSAYPSKARAQLGWVARLQGRAVVQGIVN